MMLNRLLINRKFDTHGLATACGGLLVITPGRREGRANLRKTAMPAEASRGLILIAAQQKMTKV